MSATQSLPNSPGFVGESAKMRAERKDNIYKFLSDETSGTRENMVKIVLDDIMRAIEEYDDGYGRDYGCEDEDISHEDTNAKCLSETINDGIRRLGFDPNSIINDQIQEYIFELLTEPESDDDSDDMEESYDDAHEGGKSDDEEEELE
jgi:hypothetical protein